MEKRGTIVDVRTTEEFRGRNVSGSINIPLQEFEKRMDELKTLEKPLILMLCIWWEKWSGTQLSCTIRD